jgi:predicted short-subunit dehydrogenase-like oxidoreductase (DUF2520 family)
MAGARMGVPARRLGCAEPAARGRHAVEELLADSPVGDLATAAGAARILGLVVVDGPIAADLVLWHVVVLFLGLRG